MVLSCLGGETDKKSFDVMASLDPLNYLSPLSLLLNVNLAKDFLEFNRNRNGG